MIFRFKQRARMAKGVRLNIGNKVIGLSLGGRGWAVHIW
ncbi:DUF4236 domain-containing protein [Methylomicrobium lacus]|nr:DUF4236 domain-containing protein [Methylomicrobium lacus]